MNKQQWQQINQQLAGIELPPEPNWWLLIWIIMAVCIVLLLIGLLIWQKRKSSSHDTLADQATQRLIQLQQAWQSGELDQRHTAYQLATLLRLGLGLQQLNTTPAHLADQQTQWQATINTLQQLRYQSSSAVQLTDETFGTIRSWLKRGTTTC